METFGTVSYTHLDVYKRQRKGKEILGEDKVAHAGDVFRLADEGLSLIHIFVIVKR